MLRISKLADYATVILVHLARQNLRISNAKEIAEQTHLKAPTVSKLLKMLANGGVLNSVRGTKGGYSLARKPEEVAVAEIIQIVEGRYGLTECSFKHGVCFLEPYCNVQANWQMVSQAIETALNQVTVADLARPAFGLKDLKIGPSQDMRGQEVADGKE